MHFSVCTRTLSESDEDLLYYVVTESEGMSLCFNTFGGLFYNFCRPELPTLFRLSLCLVEPKPVYAQPGQPDVDLPVSPSDAPVPSAAHDDSILR